MENEAVSILLIEDNPGDVILIKEMVKDLKHNAFQIFHRDNLAKGMELLTQQKFRVILLDLSLSDSFGLDTVSKMLEKVSDIPIIVLTGTDDHTLALEAVKSGAQDYLIKGKLDYILLERSIYYAIERAQIQKDLRKSEELISQAYNRANFYKDLFMHDMNNILQNILSSTELSFEYLADPKNIELTKRILEFTKEQIFRGARLIKNVRKLSLLEEIQTETYPIYVKEVLEHSIQYLKKNFPKTNININSDIQDEKIQLRANSFLHDIFENLLINSVTHNKNTEIKINIRISKERKEEKSYIRIEIIDNGVGIEDSWKKTIFIRGIDEVKSLIGMGLGLSLVKKIIDGYNGEVWVEDRIPGDFSQGSNFIIEILEVS